MNAVRTATLLLVCLGLALPSAPGIALCIGDVDVKAPTDAACAGRESGGCKQSTDARESHRGLEAVDESRDCRDVILRRDIATSPPKTVSEKHRPHQSLAEAVGDADRRAERDATLVAGTRLTATAHRIATLRSLSTVVLRL